MSAGAWAITGGRDRFPGDHEIQAFLGLVRKLGVMRLLHGDCRGTDRYVAGKALTEAALPSDTYPADWYPLDPVTGKRRPLDRSAGPRRNAAMVADACGLIAFPGGNGTADCVRQARANGLPVWLITAGGNVLEPRP